MVSKSGNNLSQGFLGEGLGDLRMGQKVLFSRWKDHKQMVKIYNSIQGRSNNKFIS